MELAISIVAAIVSVATFLFTIMVTYRGEQREKKQATLNALNVLQEQVFDNLNTYTFGEIKEVAIKWSEAIAEKNKYVNDKNGGTPNDGELKNEFHTEFSTLVEKIDKIEKNIRE